MELPWGDTESLRIELPENWQLLGIMEPERLPPLNDVGSELSRALKSPAGCEPLIELARKSRAVSIIVDDASRPTPAWLLLHDIIKIVREGGIDEKNISIVFATGLHRPMNEQEMEKKVGPDVIKRFRCINHNSRDKNNLLYLGRTSRGIEVWLNRKVAESDLIVSIGTIEPHVQAGFGGGYKNIIPGVAGAMTISENHFLGASEEHFSMIGFDPESNPMRLDLEEGAKMLKGKVFIVNTVLNPELKIVKIVAGDPVEAHREGLKTARRIYGVKIPEKADIVITNSYPMHLNLRQDVKSVANTLFAAKNNGTILALWRSIRGIDDMKIQIPNFVPPIYLIRAMLKIIGSRGIKLLTEKLLLRKQPEDRFFIYFALQAIRRNNILIYSPSLFKEAGTNSRGLPVFEDIGKMFRVADRLNRNKNKPTVLVFPKGGITYPVIEREE